MPPPTIDQLQRDGYRLGSRDQDPRQAYSATEVLYSYGGFYFIACDGDVYDVDMDKEEEDETEFFYLIVEDTE